MKMKTLNLRQAFLTIMHKNKEPKPQPRPLSTLKKKYPNWSMRRGDIVHYVYKPKDKRPNFEDVKALPIRLKLKKIRIDSGLTKATPPQHDFINFKNMTGNEILYNMTNFKFFRNSELVNCLYEFSRRLELPENQEDQSLRKYNWLEHEYFAPVYNEIVWKMHRMNLRHIIVAILAIDRMGFNGELQTWNSIQAHIDRLMHKLKPPEIVLMLKVLNKHPNRSSKDFLNKLLTIIPIHVERLEDEDLLTLIRVCLDQDLVNQRLFDFFIYPQVELRVKRLKLSDYIEVLRLLCMLHYQDDLVFWNAHILPCIFNFEFNEKQINRLLEAMMKVKVECPLVECSKHIILIENVIKQFQNMREAGDYRDDILLKLDQDYTLIPIQKKTFSMKEVKEAERRLKDKAVLKQFMDKFNAQETDELRSQEAQMNLDKLLEVKDWKKAKYEINLEEMEKIKKAKQEAKEEKEAAAREKKEKKEKKESASQSPSESPSQGPEENVETISTEAPIDTLSSKYIEKKVRKMKRENKSKTNKVGKDGKNE